MQLYFITTNAKKLAVAQMIIPSIQGLAIDLPELQELDAHKIIHAKLAAAFEHRQGAFVVEDTSLYFDGMNGLPGPFVKWFLAAIGAQGLYNISEKFNSKKAVAKTIIGYAHSPEQIHFFEGIMSGQIVSPRGPQHFGFEPIFQPDGFALTFAEMSQEEKNAISARAQAFRQLRDHLVAHKIT